MHVVTSGHAQTSKPGVAATCASRLTASCFNGTTTAALKCLFCNDTIPVYKWPQVEELMQPEAGLIRHRGKIQSVISNAK